MQVGSDDGTYTIYIFNFIRNEMSKLPDDGNKKLKK